MLETLPSEARRTLLSDYAKRRKSLLFAYFAWLFLGWHYLYLKRVGLQFAFWLTLGGLLVWWVVDMFRVGPMVNRLNEDTARDLMVSYRAMYAPGFSEMEMAVETAESRDEALYGVPDENDQISYTLVVIFTVLGIAALIAVTAFASSIFYGQTEQSKSAIETMFDPSNTAEAGQSRPAAESAWTLTDTTDPMTDVQTQAATKDIAGDRYVIQTTIKCVAFENLLYEFSVFDSENKGVEMTSPPDATALLMMKSGVAPLLNGGSPSITSMIRFAVRADDAKALIGTVYDPKYANRLIISKRTMGIKPTDISGASHLLIRLPTRRGDETIDIDQTDPNIASVLRTCNGGYPPPGTGEFNDPQPGETPAPNGADPSTSPDETVNASEPESTGNFTL